MDLKEYLNILLRRKWVVIATLLFTMSAVMIFLHLQTPIYESSVTLRIAASASGSQNYYYTTYATQLLNTTVQIATSHSVQDELMGMLGQAVSPEIAAEVITNTELIKLTVEHPDPKVAWEAANQLANILMQRSSEIYSGGSKNSAEVLTGQLAAIESDILASRTEYNHALQKTPSAEQEADLLYQDLLQKQALYYSLLTQVQESQYQEIMRENMITVVEPAVLSVKPAKPLTGMIEIIGFGVGLIGGLTLAFLFESFDPVLHSAREIEKVAGIPVFLKIPRVRRSKTQLDPNIITPLTDVFQHFAAKFRRLDAQETKQVVLLFSAQANQGKSLIVAHLAAYLANSKKKVVAVDCDLRMPVLHSWFNLSNETGLSEYLDKRADIKTILKKSQFEGLTIITGGEPISRPVPLLESAQMDKLISFLKKNFDYVILDTPALTAVGDVEAICGYAEVMFLVARCDKVEREHLLDAVNLIKEKPGIFTGLIVNGESHGSDSYTYLYGKIRRIPSPHRGPMKARVIGLIRSAKSAVGRRFQRKQSPQIPSDEDETQDGYPLESGASREENITNFSQPLEKKAIRIERIN